MSKINIGKIDKQIIISIGIIVAVILELVFIGVSVNKWFSLARSQKEMYDKFEKMKKEWNDYNVYKKKEQDLNKMIANFKNKAITSYQKSAFLSFLSTSMEDFGLSIYKQRVLPPTGEYNYKWGKIRDQQIIIEMTGSFPKFAEWWQYLKEEDRYIVGIENLKIERTEDGNNIYLILWTLIRE